MEIIGKVVKLGNLINGTSARGPWQKQELIIETDEQYPKTVCLNCWSDLANEAANLAPGQMVKAQISVESREFNGKWYTDVRVWRFDPIGQNAAQSAAPAQAHQTPPQSTVAPISASGYSDHTESSPEDDLPF